LTLFYLATIYSGNNGALLPGETAAILATAVLLHFFLIFPGGFRQFQLPFRLSLSSLIWFGYISAVVAISCLIINSFWPGLAALGRSLVYLHLSLITLANLAVVIIKAFRVEGRQARSEIRVITLTLALVCSPLLLLVWLPNLFFPKMETLVNGPELIGILGLLPVGVGYSIVQYKSLGIRNLARRDAARLLLLLLLVLFYVVLLRASEEISVNFSLEAHLFLYAGLGCILAFCFHPLQKKLQKLLDQLLFKDFYDYRKALFNITTKISQQFELENVAWVVLTELTQVFNLEMAALVLYRQLPGQAPDVYYSKYLRHTPNLVQLPLLEAATTLALPQVGRVYLAWSRSGEGPLVLLQIGLEENNYATLVLGSKLNAESLSREDVNLLETLVGSVKISLQKALLLNDLEQKILQLQNYSEQIRLSKDELQKLSQQVIRASEEERVRLACEIHDDPLQRLMLVLRQFDPRDQTITPREQFCWSLVKEVSATLRAICTQLRPPLLDDIGLYPALEALSEQFWRENHLAVCLEVAPQLETTRFPSELEIVLYRVIQEALQNVVKHAQASQAHVKLCHQHDLLTLQVIDNGCGLLKSVEKASLLAQGNLGLVGLRERVQSVGGVFEVSNRQDGGTLLQAQFSLPTALKDADCLSPLSPVETGLSRLP
jgi:signal transduction histidine kinase